MSKRTQFLSTPEEKAAWKRNQNLGSRFGSITPSNRYNPQPKAPSRADVRRVRGKERKAAERK